MSDGITSLWRRPYTLRRYEPQKYVDGYAVKGHTDITVKLNVQFLSGKELQLLPEGKRKTQRIKAYGNTVIKTADVENETAADRLYFQGQWWECEESVTWEKTMLAHCKAVFVRVTEVAEMDAPIDETEVEE